MKTSHRLMVQALIVFAMGVWTLATPKIAHAFSPCVDLCWYNCDSAEAMCQADGRASCNAVACGDGVCGQYGLPTIHCEITG